MSSPIPPVPPYTSLTAATPAWVSHLPILEQEYAFHVPLSEYTTMGVGGPAEVWAEPRSWDEVSALVFACHKHAIPLTLIGKGSNLMVRDGGLKGVVARLSRGVDAIVAEGETLYAEAGASSGAVARAARESGLGGLSFLAGIPGAIGGALRMNAGAYGGETFAYMERLWLLDENGQTIEKEPSFCNPRYRATTLPTGWVFKAALWRLPLRSKDEIKSEMQQVNRSRSAAQPLHMPSSGSWFKNVPVIPQNVDTLSQIAQTPLAVGGILNAWRVVAAAGCRGLRVGGAQVSEVHCNFFVNAGLHELKQGTVGGGPSATAADFEALSQQVESAVTAQFGLTLAREVRWVGEV